MGLPVNVALEDRFGIWERQYVALDTHKFTAFSWLGDVVGVDWGVGRDDRATPRRGRRPGSRFGAKDGSRPGSGRGGIEAGNHRNHTPIHGHVPSLGAVRT